MAEHSSNGKTPGRSWPDSPWLWFGLFALMALAALSVVGPRFARRQSLLEQNYHGRREAWEQRVQREAAGHKPSAPADGR